MDTILYVSGDATLRRGKGGVTTLRTTDRRSWDVVGEGVQDWGVPKIATVPGEPNRVFAGTRGDGVWASEDFGKTWKKPSYGKRGPGKIRALTYDPNDGGRLYAGCEPIDIFVSEDFGASWELLDGLWDHPWIPTVRYVNDVVEPHVRDIVIDPYDPKTIYAALQVGYIMKSTDGGATWTLLDRDYDCDVHTIVVDPSDTNHMLIATGGHDGHLGKVDGRSLYMTEDGGESWDPIGMEFEQSYGIPLRMHPTRPKVLYSALAHGAPGRWRQRETGAESVWIRSEDGGRSWRRIEKGLDGTSRLFPEEIVVDVEAPDCVYAACTSGDLFISEDAGESWFAADVGLSGATDIEVVHA